MLKILVIRSEEGNISEKSVIESEDIYNVVKEYAEKAFQQWNPSTSDFTVLRTKYEYRVKLPIDPDLLDLIEELNLDKRMELGELVIEVPLVTISYDNEWIGENYHEKRMYIVTPYLDSRFEEEIEKYAIDATKEAKSLAAIEGTEPATLTLSEEELRRLEEGLEEIEETEKKQKRKSRRRRKKR